MTTRLRRVWDRGEAALNGWLSIPSTVTAEMVARQDYDSIVVDLQRGLIDYQMALPHDAGDRRGERWHGDRPPAVQGRSSLRQAWQYSGPPPGWKCQRQRAPIRFLPRSAAPGAA